ncbi:MAG: PKD domain-containing protein [Bacteroidetes bacterium]|nr:PKD domain-containing protein [Bacteroidota bacterium]
MLKLITKKLTGKFLYYCFPALLFFTLQGYSQVFWTEDFGSGCNTGFPADGLTTANGTWTVDSTVGFNATYANDWFISAHVNNNGAGNCANDCSGGSNQTLHVGNTGITTPVVIPGDSGSYLTGAYCGFGVCSSTSKRAVSPVIDCTGKTGITLDFLYYEGGDVADINGNATLWYFDGSTWTQIDPLPKTSNGGCAGTIYGTFTVYSLTLPASADNNSSVKLGFQWDNDDSGTGTDPSAAFDDIHLSTSTSAAPVADFDVDFTSICEGDTVYFSDLSTNTPTSWQWTFPGGTPGTSTDQNPVGISYSLAGVYDVILVATNADGSDTETKTGFITVNVCTGEPIADFIASDSIICEGDAIDFTDLSTNAPTGWQWSFPGGTPATSTDQNPTGIVYSAAGIYDVTLYASNSFGTDTFLHAGYITVNVCGGGPVANFSASSTNLCTGDLIDYTDLSTNSPTTWDWTFFGATPGTSTDQNPVGISYPASGNYNVQLIVSNGNGSDTLLFSNYISVTACVPPIAGFTASDTVLCTGDSISFFDLSTGNPTAYQWTFFGATPPVSSVPNPTGIFYNTPGLYTVQLIVNNSSGSDTIVFTNYINVNACIPPVAGFTASQTTLCEGSCIDFTDQSFGTPTTWLWLFPGSNIVSSTDQNPVNVCYADSGSYNVTLIVKNDYGSDTLIQTNYITVDTCPKPIVHFMATDTFFCSNNCIDFIDLSDNIDGTTSWHWIFPGGVPSEDSVRNPRVCYPEEGIFDAILIETNQYGSDTLVLSQYINVINVPGSFISNDTAIYFGGSVQLHAGGGVSYQWSSQIPGSTFVPGETDPDPIVTPNSYPPDEAYTYYCEITDGTTGCTTKKQVTIEILHVDHIFVPNSFKPSSSGANSTVGVYATNVKKLSFVIYDRWGEKVFESSSPCPDTGPCDPTGWDGKYKGKDCEMGTYVYTLFLISEGGNIYHKNGNITLIR